MINTVRQITEHAYCNSEFYQEKLRQTCHSIEEIMTDWEKIPVVSKEEIMQSKQSLIPYQYYGKLARGELLSTFTSGSTGKCMEIFFDQNEMTKALLSLWLYRKRYYGIEPKDPFCYFYTMRNIQEDQKIEYRKNGMGFSKINLMPERIVDIYEHMQEYHPKWLILQPSIATLLAKYVFESGVDPLDELEYIELSGEMFTEQNRNFIEKAFEVPVASQYGCNEIGTIAYECPLGHLHIMENNVYVDIMKDGKRAKIGEEGTIVVTSRNNYVMPFIKYDLGDYGMFTGEECSCGNSGKILKLTRGRKNDLILLKDKTVMGVDEFVRAFLYIDQQIDGKVYQYKICQKGYNQFEVYVVTDEREEIIKRLFLQSLQSKELRQSEYWFQFSKFLLPDERSGKLRFFKNELYDNV